MTTERLARETQRLSPTENRILVGQVANGTALLTGVFVSSELPSDGCTIGSAAPTHIIAPSSPSIDGLSGCTSIEIAAGDRLL